MTRSEFYNLNLQQVDINIKKLDHIIENSSPNETYTKKKTI